MTIGLWKIPSTTFAISYYGEGNYNSDRPDQFQRSQWHGKGAELLGLRDRVDIESLTRVMNGDTFDGRCIGQVKGQTFEAALRKKRNPAYDLTFSPPKDVSLLYYLGGDERIEIAHQSAASKTLDWLEQKMSFPRSPVERRTCWDENRKIVVAKFNHDISRGNDPHLHTHALIINMINDLGRWSALNSFKHFAYSAVIRFAYDRYLKQSLRAFGYQLGVDPTKKKDWFVSGVSRHAVDEFSKRHFQIASKLNSLKFTNHKAQSNAERDTREGKTITSMEDLNQKWEVRGKEWLSQLKDLCALARGRTHEQMIESSLSVRLPNTENYDTRHSRFAKDFFIATPNTENEANDPYTLKRVGSERDYATRASVSYSLRCNEQFGKPITIHALRKLACKFAVDGITIDDIDKQIRELFEENKDSFKYDTLEQKLVTPNIVPEESKFRPFMEQEGKNLLPQNLSRRNERFTNLELSPDQENAINTILASKNLLVGIEGYPGTGEIADSDRTSKFCNDLLNAFEDKPQPVIGIMTYRSVNQELSGSPNFHQHENIDAKEISRMKKSNLVQNPIIVVDVTNLSASTLLFDKLEKCMMLNPKRIVLLDNLNLSKLPSTRRHAYSVLQNAGIERAIINDIDNVKHVCEQTNTSIYQLRNAIDRIGASISEESSNQKILDNVFKHLKLPPNQSKEDAELMRSSTQDYPDDAPKQSNSVTSEHRITNDPNKSLDRQTNETSSDRNAKVVDQTGSSPPDGHKLEDPHISNDHGINCKTNQNIPGEHEVNQSRDSQVDLEYGGSNRPSTSTIISLPSNPNSNVTGKDEPETTDFSEIFHMSNRTTRNDDSRPSSNNTNFIWANSRTNIVIPNPYHRQRYNHQIRQRLIDLGVLGETVPFSVKGNSEDLAQQNQPVKHHSERADPKEPISLIEQYESRNLVNNPIKPNVAAKYQNTQSSSEASASNESFASKNSVLGDISQNDINPESIETKARLSNEKELSDTEKVSEPTEPTSKDNSNNEIENDTNLNKLSTFDTSKTSPNANVTIDVHLQVGDANSEKLLGVASDDDRKQPSFQIEQTQENIETTNIEGEQATKECEPISRTIETSELESSLGIYELRLNEELLLRNLDSQSSMTTAAQYTSATVVDFDNQTVTLNTQDTQLVLRHDDPLLQSAEYGYAKPPQASEYSRHDDVVMILRSQDNVTPETFNLMIDSAQNSETMNIFVDDKVNLAKSIEAHCSIEVPVSSLDTNWMSKLETEAKLYSQANYSSETELNPHYSESEFPDSLPTGNSVPDKPLDFEIDHSR